MTTKFLPALLLILLSPVLRAGTSEEVRAADTARVMATIAGNASRLDPLLSSELVYAHSDGRVQTKAEFLNAVRSGKIKYDAYDYDDVKVKPVTDDVVTMTGRAHLRASIGDVRAEFSLKFLAVWRRENGVWRLFAYQSSRLPDK
jgi:hypothetical protein